MVYLDNRAGPKPYRCTECPKSFARRQQRDIHMVVHTGEKKFLCSECGNSFGSASTLIDHRKRKHLELRDFCCDTCPKKFFNRQELEAHVRSHNGDRPFTCSVIIIKFEPQSFLSTPRVDRSMNFISSNAARRSPGFITSNDTSVVFMGLGRLSMYHCPRGLAWPTIRQSLSQKTTTVFMGLRSHLKLPTQPEKCWMQTL